MDASLRNGVMSVWCENWMRRAEWVMSVWCGRTGGVVAEWVMSVYGVGTGGVVAEWVMSVYGVGTGGVVAEWISIDQDVKIDIFEDIPVAFASNRQAFGIPHFYRRRDNQQLFLIPKEH
ncbi:hypothetical protein HNY73_017910 [Argiope bruennichi]|uniref:Uncharacterized protein n=1 Tax=Argiope bruennichi TaxID=94029 RepID=A0A8T0EG41_ARGBR|nr:hypothetical protein HNY73_017910 [Argiope bruennichi]